MRRSPVRALGGRPRAGPLFRGCLETSPPAERVRAGARKDRGVVGWKEDRVKVSLGIDVACRADHRASLAGPDGEFLWSGWRFRTSPLDLEALWSKIPAGAEVQVVMEPTRNAWVPLQAWLEARGAVVVLVPPEQSADLRNYYNKHTKTDRLDSRVLARLPLLHPEGLESVTGPTPADPFRRAVRRRTKLVKASRGAWREPKADELLAAAEESLELWKDGGLDLDELAADIAAEVRVARSLSAEIATLEARIAPMFAAADRRPETPDDREATPPTREGDDERDVGIVASLPGLDGILGAGILARFGDFDRFHSLAGIRSFTGLVPSIDQSGNSSGHGRPTKAGDPGLREALYLAADHLRRVDPHFAQRYHRLIVEEGKHHESAVCTLAAVAATRIAACWRRRECYVLRDTDGREITKTEGRAIVAERYTIPDDVRRARRRVANAKHLKGRTDRRDQKSTRAAPASGPSSANRTGKTTERVA